MKIRVHELAKELGQESKTLLRWLAEQGEFVKSASSTLEPPVVRRLRDAYPAAKVALIGASVTPLAVPPRPLISSAVPAQRAVRYSVDRLSSWQDAVELSRQAHAALESGSRLILDCSTTSHVFPNGCVPAAAVIQDFRAIGLDVTFDGEASYVRTASLRNPLEASQHNLLHQDVFSRVWVYFDPEQASALARRVVLALEKRVDCEEGVLDALNICLYEALDNVFEHSQAKSGYFMAQIHKQNAQLTVCIVDAGIGARKSFRGSKYRPASDFDALTLAIQSGVSRTGDKRGNGLHFLHETAQQNGGRLVLKSGAGNLRLENGNAQGDNDCQGLFGAGQAGFIIDWQMELATAVSLKSALGFPMPNLEFESRQDDFGQVVVSIGDHEAGTGSRTAAAQLRVYLSNQLKQGATSVLLDFEGVSVVSASFADEVIGKLAEELGPLRFFQRFQLRNMTPLVEGLLDRAIKLRLSTEPPAPIARQTLDLAPVDGPRHRVRTRGGYRTESPDFSN